jgi:hypothetical protein
VTEVSIPYEITFEEVPVPDTEDGIIDESEQDDAGLVDIGESSLTHFGADFDVAGLVRRLDDGDIIVPRFDPDESTGSELSGFQRQRVWSTSKMEKFIESLLLGWPVPSIFLVVDADQRYLVLDGQQRLTTLQSFVHGRFPNGRQFVLRDVAEHLKNASFESLNKESRRKLNNTFFQATVIEPKGTDGRESVYRLFGRLNSGGVTLTAQEIRVALYRGPVVDWIRDLNHDVNWRRLFGAPHIRLKDHELILRSVALREVVAESAPNWAESKSLYNPPMSDFLNSFLERHRRMDDVDRDVLDQAFAAVCEALVVAGGAPSLRYQGSLNAAHVDAVLSTLMQLSIIGAMPEKDGIVEGLRSLRDSTAYSEFVTRSTSHSASVTGRLHSSWKAFTGS